MNINKKIQNQKKFILKNQKKFINAKKSPAIKNIKLLTVEQVLDITE